ncbi:glycine--tRNA ligase subunit beta [Candidatus Pantoea edessiphila]|uniref:Glycine--tRNA ligase beta subunit n=1 Tax=Candidatus Pantoea edessiphila TaxID=2044610 RepID=A0A2P5SVD1_9GAMM|nr:glycine--tRNA ligase subunit beta [Candidatus Pantoea edessiphila]PPI86285.1 glycine--tRNA ligase subunit beta [Candidatus Pantoea edessiphila]
MNGKTLLIEIGTEELPPKKLRVLAQLFYDNIINEFNNFRFTFETVFWFASPRRLAIKTINLQPYQLDIVIEKRGPTLIDAFDIKGNLTQVAMKWLKNNNIVIDQVATLHTIKGKWLIYRKVLKGEKVQLLLPLIIEKSLKNISSPKSMKWGESSIKFIRPIRNITVVFGNKLVPGIILGIKTTRIVYGHRFMGKSKITLANADQYPQIILDLGKVIADHKERKKIIKNNIELIAYKLGGQVDTNDDLLEEVTSLVEWPVVLYANFEKFFLDLPKEILIHIMKHVQKYFPLYDSQGILLSKFIFVSNIESNDMNSVIIGNEKILNSRLVDAKFFFDHDRKKWLEDNLVFLDKVIFHRQLGSLKDKTKRVVNLCKFIAVKIGADIKNSMRAALLSKCDLVSSIVFEFTEMQGIMGMYYARYNGETEDVALALGEQYKPCNSTDVIPSSLIGCTLAISDKIDTLIGMFSINQFPKGSADPLALRRAAFGILRIILERQLPLSLHDIAEAAVVLYKDQFKDQLTNSNTVSDFLNFMFSRLQKLYLRDGYSVDICQAVLSVRPLYPIDFDLRIKALTYFLSLKESNSLIIANKRVANFLIKSKRKLPDSDINLSLLNQEEEIVLANNILTLTVKLEPYFNQYLYKEILIELSKLKNVIDKFFNKVIINTSNMNIYVNRLILLSKLRFLFLKVADISLLKNKN